MTTETCRRGHPRTDENTKVSTYRRNGKEYVLRQCQECAATRNERKRDTDTADGTAPDVA